MEPPPPLSKLFAFVSPPPTHFPCVVNVEKEIENFVMVKSPFEASKSQINCF